MLRFAMSALCACLLVACSVSSEPGAEIQVKNQAVEEGVSQDLAKVFSPLETPCQQNSWQQDCAAEIKLAKGDDCVVWPEGVYCHPIHNICVVTIDTECYFDAGFNQCQVDADCNDGNECTFETCVHGEQTNWCYQATKPDSTPCGYSTALNVPLVCETIMPQNVTGCVPDMADPECLSDAECVDENGCTLDVCHALTQTCEHLDIPECCNSNTDCGSDNPYCVEDIFPPEESPDMFGWCQPCLQDDTNTGCTGDTSICAWGVNETLPPLPSQGKSVYWCTECVTDSHCDDGDPCTIDSCDVFTDSCEHHPDPSCENVGNCSDNTDCVDFSSTMCYESLLVEYAGECSAEGLCKSVLKDISDCPNGCVNAQCVPDPEPQPLCESESDCDDGDACTGDHCMGATLGCENTPIPNCVPCSADADCDSLNTPKCVNNIASTPTYTCQQGSCTYVVSEGEVCEFGCENGACKNAPLPQTCATKLECNDDDPCTDDTCFMGKCYNTPLVNCTNPQCSSNNDCSYMDGNACTSEFYSSSVVGVCSNQNCIAQTQSENFCATGCGDDGLCNAPECVENTDCNDSDPCTQDECSADGTCKNVLDANCTSCQTASDCPVSGESCVESLCENGMCTSAWQTSGSCSAVGGSCNTTADCPDDVQWNYQTCNVNQCVYIDPKPVVHVMWDMPESWFIDYVHLEGTFCKLGAKAAQNETDQGIMGCNFPYGWGPFPQNGDGTVETVWNASQIENNVDDPLVQGYVEVPAGAHWMIVQWVYSHNNEQLNWLCNDTLGPKKYDDEWKDLDTWGDHFFYTPDGQALPVSVKPGNNMMGCLFWINVSSLAALN